MKTTENMQDRARARQERIHESKALLQEARRRQQERQGKAAQPEVPVKAVEPTQNAPVIARHLREQILTQNPVLPMFAEGDPDLRTQMLSEFRLETIRQIEKGEWDIYFESLIQRLVRASEAGT